MATADTPTLRKDVRQIMERNIELQLEGLSEFLTLEENRAVDFQGCMKAIGAGHRQHLKIMADKERSIHELSGIVTFEEMALAARAFRYTEEYAADVKLKAHPIAENAEIKELRIGGVSAEWQTAPEAVDGRVLLYFHGGGQIFGSPKTHRQLTVELGRAARSAVLSVDYRLAPEHPFPSGLQDCFSSYRWLLEQGIEPRNVVIGGDSSGGNQALATLLKIRDEAIPLPAGGFALSPAIDYTFESETNHTNRRGDVLAAVATFWWDLAYLGDTDPYHPYASPVHADLHGLPPLLVQASVNEMLYDHATRLVQRAKRAGVDAVLQQWRDLGHVWQYFGLHELPEAKDAIDKIGKFVRTLFD